MSYPGKPTTQQDGTYYAQKNCVGAQASTLTDAASLGYWDPAPSRIRKMTGDTSGGMSFNDVASVVHSYTNSEVTLKVLYWTPATTLEDMIDDGRFVGVIIKCSVTRYTPFHTGTFTGLHCIGVYGKRVVTLASGAKQLQGKVMDPGHGVAKFIWWPWSLIIRAAKAASGTSTIHILYTRDVKSVTRVAHADGSIRRSTSTSATIVGSFKRGQSVYVADTLIGTAYTYDGRKTTGWNKLGTGKYAVVKIR